MTRKRLAYALLASLAVNLFGAGALTATVVGSFGRASPVRHSDGDRVHFETGMRALQPDSRRAFDAIWQDRQPEIRDLFARVRAARQAAGEAFMAEPLDRRALDTALDELVTASAALQHAMHDLMAEAADVLPAEDRRRLRLVAGRQLRSLMDRNGDKPDPALSPLGPDGSTPN